MLVALLGESAELAPLKQLIVDKTEGNPLYMEETVQVLLDEGALVRNGVATKFTKLLGGVDDTVDGAGDTRLARRPAAARCQSAARDAGRYRTRVPIVLDSCGCDESC